MTNPTDLDELRALLEKATPGTLRAEAGETAKLRDDFGLVAIMSHLTRYPLPVAGAATPSRRRDSDKVAALAHLVAAAINALPALMDELEAARAKLEAIDQRARRLLESNPGAMIWPNDAAYAVWGSDWEAVLKGAPVRVDDSDG